MREAALYLTGFQRRHVYCAGVDLHPQEVIDRLRARAVDVSRSMSLAVSENLARHDVEVVEGRARLGPNRTVVVTSPTGGLERSMSADVVLVATGSRPFHPPGIPFDDPDVLDSETARDLDRPMQSLIVVGGGAVACEYASIFMALGAVVTLIDRGKRLLPFLGAALASASMEQGRVAACYALGIPFKLTVDPLTPFGVYAIPECAMVGLTEGEAVARGHNFVTGKSQFVDNSRAAIAGTTEGMVKVVVDRDSRRLRGAHIVGEGATELIHHAQAVLHFGGTLDYFIHATFDVPTMSDSYKYAAYDCLQRMATPSEVP
jgi:pyruvate/2-oxoglutarate dehydrogenase complex dihydrolipoamide dehydrogenase (E3) component